MVRSKRTVFEYIFPGMSENTTFPGMLVNLFFFQKLERLAFAFIEISLFFCS